MNHQLVEVNQGQIQLVIGDESPKGMPASASGDTQDLLPLYHSYASLLPREPFITSDMKEVYGANSSLALNRLLI